VRSDTRDGYAVRRLRTLAFSDLAGVVREAIDAERIRIGPRIKKLRGLLAEARSGIDGARRHTDPPPRQSGGPSLLFRS
jgi:hypothetical protein